MLLNVFDADVAIGLPKQELEYNSHVAFVPKDPPLMLKSTLPGLQRVSLLAVSEVGLLEEVANNTSTFTHAVVLQYPVALAK